MILSDREISAYLNQHMIEIDPRPDETAYSSTSVDLTLDETISEFRTSLPGNEEIIDPRNVTGGSESLLDKLTDKHQIGSDGFVLQRGSLYLAWTRERVNLKPEARLAARVEGKSALARIGLAVHVTAPTIHAGFCGQIRLEVVNHGPRPIRVRSHMRICQLIFEQTFGTPNRGYQGQFLGQGTA
ncbi:MAG: dCTP deaminase [Alphaproteobacteria bacterium]|nr:dCTP deaminase [Alphaproteobacteria bacterium]